MVKLVTSEEAKSSLFGMALCFHRLAQEAEAAERADLLWEPDPRPEGDPQSPP
jgi:hypothetical protein